MTAGAPIAQTVTEMTGLAQTEGLRGPSVDPILAFRRVAPDVQCMRRFLLWLDVKIIWWMIMREFRSGNGF
jgi:lipopolysaccharide/colanic/teichoic acid biosynthesis glycosyltransferase